MPLEPQLVNALTGEHPDRQHEELVFAWETVCKIIAGSTWAVCRRLGLTSTEFERQLRKLVRPSFGDWVGLIRATRSLLHDHDEPEARMLAPLLEGLGRKWRDTPGLRALGERIQQLPDRRAAVLQGRTLHDLLQALPAYRNVAQSTHSRVDSEFRAASTAPLLQALLEICELAPPLGGFRLVVVNRLERGEEGHRAALFQMHHAFAQRRALELDEETWNGLAPGRPYLFHEPGRFVPLFPIAAAESVGATLRIGWLTGRVHLPTLAYEGGPGGSFQLALDAGDYESLLGPVAPDGDTELPAEVLAMRPFRGLLAYGEQHAPTFFGREEEAATAATRLAAEGTLVLCGASGAGKSSLMNAGILPQVRARLGDLTVIAFRPGSNPLQALRRELHRQEFEAASDAITFSEQVSRLLPDDPTRVEAQALAHLARGLGRGRHVVMCVDQLEESTALCSDRVEQQVFLQLLATLASEFASHGCLLVCTVRADHLPFLLQHEGFRGLLDRHALGLGDVSQVRLLRMITEPVRGRGVRIEPGLPETILADVGDQPGNLALLSQVLTTLWNERERHGFELTKQGYEAAGRVTGALRRQADEARQESLGNALDPRVLDRALLQLAQPTKDGTYSRQCVSLPDLADAVGAGSAEVRRWLEPFVQRRLLVVGEDGGGEDHGSETVEVAHEALLTAWPHLADMLQSRATELALRDEIAAASTRWEQAGRKRELWSDATSRLSRAEELLTEGRLALTGKQRDFVAASRASVQRRHRIERLAGMGLLTLAALASLGFLQAEANAAEAEFNLEQSDRAQRQERLAREDAERLTDYLINDLYDRLVRLGRVDLLESVAREASEYHVRTARQSTGTRKLSEIANLRHLASIARQLGDLAEAEQLMVRAREAFANLPPTGEPGGTAREAENLNLHLESAELFQAAGRLGRAAEAVDAALLPHQATLTDLGVGSPHRSALALLLRRRGELEARLGRPSAAQNDFDQALRVLGAVVARPDPALSDIVAYHQCQVSLGYAFLDMGSIREAGAMFEGCLQGLRRLRDGNRDDAVVQDTLAAAVRGQGQYFQSVGDLDNASAAAAENVELSRRRHLIDPGSDSAKIVLAKAYLTHAHIEESRQNPAESEGLKRKAEELLEVTDDDFDAPTERCLAALTLRLSAGDLRDATEILFELEDDPAVIADANWQELLQTAHAVQATMSIPNMTRMMQEIDASRAICARLLTRDPDCLTWSVMDCRTRLMLAGFQALLKGRFDRDVRLQLLDEIEADIQSIAAQRPDWREVHTIAMEAQTFYIDLYETEKDWPSALDRSRRQIEARGALAAAESAPWQDRFAFAREWDTNARLLTKSGQQDAALQAGRRAVILLEALASTDSPQTLVEMLSGSQSQQALRLFEQSEALAEAGEMTAATEAALTAYGLTVRARRSASGIARLQALASDPAADAQRLRRLVNATETADGGMSARAVVARSYLALGDVQRASKLFHELLAESDAKTRADLGAQTLADAARAAARQHFANGAEKHRTSALRWLQEALSLERSTLAKLAKAEFVAAELTDWDERQAILTRCRKLRDADEAFTELRPKRSFALLFGWLGD